MRDFHMIVPRQEIVILVLVLVLSWVHCFDIKTVGNGLFYSSTRDLKDI